MKASTKDNLIKAALGVGIVAAGAVVVTAAPALGLLKVAASDLPSQDIDANGADGMDAEVQGEAVFAEYDDADADAENDMGLDEKEMELLKAHMEKLSPEVKADIQAGFEELDRDGDDFINRDELHKLITEKSDAIDKDTIDELFDLADVNGDGKVSIPEFIRVNIDCEEFSDAQRAIADIHHQINQGWDKFDVNEDGKLGYKEAIRAIDDFIESRGDEPMGLEKLDKIFNDIDINEDGFLGKREVFIALKQYYLDHQAPDFDEVIEEIPEQFRAGLKSMWEEVDKDGDGFHTRDEIIDFMKGPDGDGVVDPKQIDSIIDNHDLDGDDKISTREFVQKALEHFREHHEGGPRHEGLSPENIKSLRQAFEKMDGNDDDLITRDELEAHMKEHCPGIKEHMIDRYWDQLDINEDKQVHWKEFLESAQQDAPDGEGEGPPRFSPEDIKHLRQAFENLDENDDGFITKDELAGHMKEALGDNFDDKMFQQHWNHMNHIQKVSWQEFIESTQQDVPDDVEVEKLSPEELKPLREAFENLDGNDDGYITKDELASAMKENLGEKFNDNMFEKHWNHLDHIQKVSFKEFLEAAQANAPDGEGYDGDAYDGDHYDGDEEFDEIDQRIREMSEENMASLQEEFKEIDADGDGTISREELAEMLKKQLDLEDVKEWRIDKWMGSIDANEDGKIDFHEWLRNAVGDGEQGLIEGKASDFGLGEQEFASLKAQYGNDYFNNTEEHHHHHPHAHVHHHHHYHQHLHAGESHFNL